MRVLVTDGDNRAALAVTRSLGRAGHEVIVGEKRHPSLASRSRYCWGSVLYPDPVTRSAAFTSSVMDHVRKARVDVLIPGADITTFLINDRRQEFEALCRVPVAPPAAVDTAADKVATLRLAEALGVPVPRSIVVTERHDVDPTALSYPIVVKPHRSRVATGDGWMSTSVSFANDAAALTRDLEQRPPHEFPLLLQERIEGPGVGVFACYQGGKAVAVFGHRRLRERPPWGGVSVLSESVRPDPAALESAKRLLDALGWDGVAMVEFKRDSRDGQARLMEINGRFWGSLQLAVDAGVDFPLILVQSVSGAPVEPQPPYSVGARSRWLWGDIDSLLLTLFARHRVPEARLPGRLRALWDFARPAWRVRLENPRLADLGPWLHETARRFQWRDRRAVAPEDAPDGDMPPVSAQSALRPAANGSQASPARVARSLTELGIACEAWRTLLAASETNTVFQTQPWFESWCQAYPGEPDPFLVAVPDSTGNRLAGVAPLAVETRPSGEAVVTFLADVRAGYCDVLAAGADKSSVLGAVLQALDQDGRWDVIEFNKIPASSQTPEIFRVMCLDKGYSVIVDDQAVCPALIIEDGDDAQTVLRRASVRRRVNRFARDGTLRCLHLTAPEAIRPFLDQFVDQHITRWAGEGTPSLFLDERNVTFHRELTKRLGATGAVVFTVIEHGGQAIAFHFGFDYNRAIVWYNSSFDVRLAKHSPGLVLLHFLIARAIAEERTELDFTIGDEKFKKRFTNHTRKTCRIRVFRRATRYNIERSRDAVRAAAKSITGLT